MELESLRREYLMGGLEREQLDDNPITQFEKWMKQAIALELKDSTAMTIATVSADGQPSQRIVLLKHVDESGFVFFTNYNSRKAKELDENPKISAHFPWHGIERQVKVCGVAEKVSTAQSLKYFASRPFESQLAAIASHQSATLTSRTVLMNQFEALRQKFNKGEVPFPDFWGGYRIVPSEVEFWQGGESRLHDRFRYLKADSKLWNVERLAP